MSMSGGWFFVVASEAISVGNTTVNLPGVGSYLAQAISRSASMRSSPRSSPMLVVIIAYDQLLFRPLVTFGAFPLRAVRLAGGRALLGHPAFPPHEMAARLTVLPARAFGAVALWRLDLPIRGQAAAAEDAAGRSALLDLVSVVVGRRGSASMASGCSALHRRPASMLARYRQASWLDLFHLAARAGADRARLARSGCRSASGSACARASPRRSSRSPNFSRPFRPTCCSRSPSSASCAFAQPRHLAEPADHLRHAMVHCLQRHRRRYRLPERSARGGDEFRHQGWIWWTR